MSLRTALVLMFAVTSAGFLPGCKERGEGSFFGLVNRGNDSNSSDGGDTPGESSAAGAPQVKTSDQLFNSYLVMTGLSPEVLGMTGFAGFRSNVFAGLEAQLPPTFEASGFAVGHQVAVVKLAGGVCNQLVETARTQPTLGNAVFGALDFNAAADVVLNTEAKRRTMVEAVFLKFWGPTNLEKLPPRTEAVSDLTQVMNQIYDDSTNTAVRNASFTRNLAKSACTAVLSSLPVVLQ